VCIVFVCIVFVVRIVDVVAGFVSRSISVTSSAIGAWADSVSGSAMTAFANALISPVGCQALQIVADVQVI